MYRLSRLVVFLFMTLSFAVMGEDEGNPLKGYVDEYNFKTGSEIFQEGEVRIFNEAQALNNSEAELKSKFPVVISVARTGGAWNSSFYFKDADGSTKRKTIRGSGVVRGAERSYAVTVFEEGIRVRDIFSGIATEIKIKRR